MPLLRVGHPASPHPPPPHGHHGGRQHGPAQRRSLPPATALVLCGSAWDTEAIARQLLSPADGLRPLAGGLVAAVQVWPDSTAAEICDAVICQHPTALVAAAAAGDRPAEPGQAAAARPVPVATLGLARIEEAALRACASGRQGAASRAVLTKTVGEIDLRSASAAEPAADAAAAGAAFVHRGETCATFGYAPGDAFLLRAFDPPRRPDGRRGSTGSHHLGRSPGARPSGPPHGPPHGGGDQRAGYYGGGPHRRRPHGGGGEQPGDERRPAERHRHRPEYSDEDDRRPAHHDRRGGPPPRHYRQPPPNGGHGGGGGGSGGFYEDAAPSRGAATRRRSPSVGRGEGAAGRIHRT